MDLLLSHGLGSLQKANVIQFPFKLALQPNLNISLHFTGHLISHLHSLKTSLGPDVETVPLYPDLYPICSVKHSPSPQLLCPHVPPQGPPSLGGSLNAFAAGVLQVSLANPGKGTRKGWVGSRWVTPLVSHIAFNSILDVTDTAYHLNRTYWSNFLLSWNGKSSGKERQGSS